MNLSDTDEGTIPKYTQQSSSQQHQNGHGYSLSVQGARHLHDTIPCQDHSLYTIDEDVIFLGVADGHGDAKHALSHVGSRLALKVAKPILTDAIRTLTIPQTKREWLSFQNNIERRIRWDWNCACKKTLGMDDQDGTWIPELIQFGTTLLACCQSPKGLLCFQIGDGDIAWMSVDNNVHFIFSESDDVIGTVTHSLCRPFEEGISQSALIPNPEDGAMLLLSTDGIRDCLQGDRERFATILPWLSKRKELDLSDIAQWLYQISTNGNGDDMSLAVHYPSIDPDIGD